MPADVLHLLGSAENEGRGIARIVSSLRRGLDPARYRLHAWFLGPPGPLIDQMRDAGIATQCIRWWRGWKDPAGAYRFWRSLRRHNFTLVHQHFGARAVRLLLPPQAPLVVQIHGRIVPPGNPIATRGANAVIAVSRAVANQVTDAQPTVIYPGVSLPPEVARDAGGAIVIGTLCRLNPEKGMLQLLRALVLLRPEFPEIRLEIAGDGSQMAELKSAVEQLGLHESVRFLGWLEDPGSALSRWGIFVLPSLDEGVPLAALEAMAVGLPVVSTNVGGLPELIDHGNTGFLVPPADPAALADRLRPLISGSQLRREMGAAGRERIRKHFSEERMVAATAAVYDSLLHNTRSHG